MIKPEYKVSAKDSADLMEVLKRLAEKYNKKKKEKEKNGE